MTLNNRSSQPGLSEVQLEGQIRQEDFPVDGSNPLEKVLGLNWAKTPLLMDFTKVEFIGSAGIGWLSVTHGALHRNGNRLICFKVKPMVQQALQLMRLDSRGVLFLADRDAALKAAATSAATGPAAPSTGHA